jgi:hypothetical protein
VRAVLCVCVSVCNCVCVCGLETPTIRRPRPHVLALESQKIPMLLHLFGSIKMERNSNFSISGGIDGLCNTSYIETLFCLATASSRFFIRKST